MADPDPVFSVAGFALFESPEMMPFFFKPLDPLCAFETTAAKAVPFGAYGVENALFWSRRHAHLIYQALEFAIIRANGGTEKKTYLELWFWVEKRCFCTVSYMLQSIFLLVE